MDQVAPTPPDFFLSHQHLASRISNQAFLILLSIDFAQFQDDVARVIRAVQPDAVVIELCKARINILHTDEAKIQVRSEDLQTSNCFVD